MKNFIALFLMFCFVSCQTKIKVDSKKPNILLIVVDDQGYADFSPFENFLMSLLQKNSSPEGKNRMNNSVIIAKDHHMHRQLVK